MSNDLISRSAVISLIDELGYVNCRNSKDFEANSRMDKIRQGVVELPTAYDVDKVVKQSKEKCAIAFLTLANIGKTDYGLVRGEIIEYIGSITKIIKAGGANE